MKKGTILTALLLAMPYLCNIARGQEVADDANKALKSERRYQIVVGSLPHEAVVMNNGRIDNIEKENSRGWKELGESITKSYKNTLVQKTVAATSGLLDLGVSFIAELVTKNSKDFDEWIAAKQQECTFNKKISSNSIINDFYYLPSDNGALDPRNMKFNGFSCRNFIEIKNDNSNGERNGHDAYYISCKLRTDSIGIAHMTNHSKFMLEIDSLVLYPDYCNIPLFEKFNYEKYTNLELVIKVNIYSSWINEAIMVASDQLLGSFNVKARIDPSAIKEIDGENVFIYTKETKELGKFVSITGDSFLVPRSFVGTNDKPEWGTGEYRIEIELFETCQLNPEHYIKIEELGNVEAVNFANLPGYKKWEKAVWKTELKKMRERKKGVPFFENALKVLTTAYIGNNWVEELVEPAVNPIYEHETKALKGLFDLE
ncbi:MAG: hypothetical protein IKL75_02455 [Bacteroidaceae bacterium]|nr:hypothetical protein [Bacteroidaceae bacterium]